MAEFEDVSGEEKLQIAQHFLLSSPPGQFHEVFNDVKKLLPEGLMTDELAMGIAHSYNTKTCKVVTAPSGSKTVICAAGEIDTTHYIDPSTGEPFGVDHLTLATANVGEDYPCPSKPATNLEQRRVQLQESLKGYLTESYPSEESAGAVFIKDGKLVITLTGEKTNLRNFWSGRITSSWTIATEGLDLAVLSLSDSQKISVSISGDIKVHAHYFEDGNVQLQTNRQFPAKNVSIVSPDKDFAGPVLNVIRESEKALEQGLSDMYVNMNEETFKQMRRLMPITRNKMEWNINAIKMVKQLRK